MSSKSKTPLHNKLQEIFDFTDEDLYANRNGRLSQRQLLYLKQSRYTPGIIRYLRSTRFEDLSETTKAILLMPLAAIIFCGLCGLLTSSNPEEEDPVITILLFAAVVIFVLQLIFRSPNNLAPPRGLRTNEVVQYQGQFKLQQYKKRYLLILDNAHLAITERHYNELKVLKEEVPDQGYNFYYLKNRGTILSAEPTSMSKDHWFEE